MFSGGVMVKDGTVQFMSHPWNKLYYINKKINARFTERDTRLFGRDSTQWRHRYIINKFTSSFSVILPTDGIVDISDAIISLPEVPVKFVLPMYKKPADKTLYSDFYKVISYEIYKHFEAIDHFKRESLVRSWKSQFYKTLMKICVDRGHDSLQLSLHDEGFRFKLFAGLIGGRVFRDQAFDWLTSRGEYSVTLIHSKGELKLTPDDFRRYFKDDWAKFASSLHLTTVSDPREDFTTLTKIESDLRYMQDFIIDTLVFIFDLAENAVNQKIVLYPQNAYEGGYGVDPYSNKYLPPRDTNLNEWYFRSDAPKNIGFVLDLNDQNSVNKFIEMIPILLGNLLVRPAAFIVREPDLEGLENDQCTFIFGMSGSLLPSQMIGHLLHSSPPPTGMKWTGGSEIDYKRSAFYLRWNEILSRHNTLCVHKLSNPNDFYDIVRKILFTNVDDIAFYF